MCDVTSMLLYCLSPRSSVNHFACIGVAPLGVTMQAKWRKRDLTEPNNNLYKTVVVVDRLILSN